MSDPWQGLKRDLETEDAEATLPKEFFTVAAKARSALEENRKDDAKRVVLDFLDTVAHPDFVAVVAEMLEAKRSQTKYPANWFEVGMDYVELKKSGVKYEVALERLAVKYQWSVRTVEDRLTFYNKANEFLKYGKLFARN